MTPGPLVFPSSRALAGWWRQLQPLHPRSLWVAHLLLHRVEAPVLVARAEPLDCLPHLLLTALDLEPAQPAESLGRRWQLGWALLEQVLRDLEARGLVRDADSGGMVTDAGRLALARGQYDNPRRERRTFTFVESGRPGHPPAYLPLQTGAMPGWPSGEVCSFPPEALHACVARPAEWKQRHDFPTDVTAVAGPEGAPAWDGVLVDRPERLLAVLALVTRDGQPRLLGFPVRQETWTLSTYEPAFSLSGDGRDVLPEVAEEPPADAWRKAWQAWGQPRGVSPAEANACGVERVDYRLRVGVPPRLLERLRAARSDAVKGETWLLAGGGRVQMAAVVELVDSGS